MKNETDEALSKEFWRRWDSSTAEMVRNGEYDESAIVYFVAPLLLELLLRARADERNKVMLWAKSKERTQLDKDDPDNYGACYAIAGWNNALTKLLSFLSDQK